MQNPLPRRAANAAVLAGGLVGLVLQDYFVMSGIEAFAFTVMTCLAALALVSIGWNISNRRK
ncbi:MAG: hypothetical protein K8I82_18485 [Anaerolineae bacterium]|jgi:high-affinity Fe2+/Pb2+ permease|nr:hypothetical protein [Anaerolineae bacterium]